MKGAVVAGMIASLLMIGCAGGADPTSRQLTDETAMPTHAGPAYTSVVESEGSWASWLGDDVEVFVANSKLVVIGTVAKIEKTEVREAPIHLLPFTPEVGKDQERPPKPFVLGAATTYRFEIQAVLRGADPGPSVRIRQGLGVVDGVLYKVSEDQPLEVGRKYLLFLVPRDSEPSVYEIHGFLIGGFPFDDVGVLTAMYPRSALASELVGKTEDQTRPALAHYLDAAD